MSFSFATDLDAFVAGDPHEAFTQLRREEPVSWQRLPMLHGPDQGFWLVMRHQDVVQVSRDAEGYVSNEGTLLVDHPPSTAPPPWTMIKSEFCSLDGAVHRAYRDLLSPSFTSKAIAVLETRIKARAERLVSEAFAEDGFDVAEKLAVPFPVGVVLGDLLGLPEEDRFRAAYWSDVLSAPEDPHFKHAPDATIRAVQEMYDYAVALYHDRKAQPQDDLASVIAHARFKDGGEVSVDVFTHFFWSMILGSFDTTAASIAGGLLALIQRPAIARELRDDTSKLPLAVEEMLRWVSAVVYFRRTATRDQMLGDKKIAAGDRVALCYPSANRDEEVFENPFEFNIHRKPNPHVSFGFGAHFCLGAKLARMEMKAFFEALLAQPQWLKQTGEVRHARSNFLNRIHTLPVEVTGAP